MKAFRAEAEWKPRKSYTPTSLETEKKTAVSGSNIWKNPVVKTVVVPEPKPGPDELLLKVKYCGICGSDSHVYETDNDGYVLFSGPAKLPCTLGHEYTGEVVETGSNVRGFRKGDVVTGESVLWCGECLPCREGMLNQCQRVELLGLTCDGAFAEHIAVKAKYCWGLNGLKEIYSLDEVLQIGALVEPLGCAYNGIFISGGGFLPGSSAIVYGAGPIGLGAVILLRISGASRIIVTDIVEERLEIASRLGADFVFNPNMDGGFEERVMDMTLGLGAEIQVEAAGAAKHTFPMMQRLCSRRGKIIYLGRADSLASVELNRMVSGAHSLIGARGHSGYGIFHNIIKLIQSGRMRGVEEIITSVYPFSEITSAFETLRNRKDAKILISI